MQRPKHLHRQAELERENADLRDTVRALRDALDAGRDEFARRLVDAEARAAKRRGELEATIVELGRRLREPGDCG